MTQVIVPVYAAVKGETQAIQGDYRPSDPTGGFIGAAMAVPNNAMAGLVQAMASFGATSPFSSINPPSLVTVPEPSSINHPNFVTVPGRDLIAVFDVGPPS
jgi:hypothetical protein